MRVLSEEIAERGTVYPIIEPVNGNSTTKISLDNYIEAGMPFMFVTNPKHGRFVGREQELHDQLVSGDPLGEYDNYIPALYVYRDTRIGEIDRFVENYPDLFKAVIYDGEPQAPDVLEWCFEEDRLYHHVILDGRVSTDFETSIPAARRVVIKDNFKRQPDNASYPPREHYTDRNTATGNPDNSPWGDYSIQGDHFAEGGGAAKTVAVHHIHYADGSDSLAISHFLSDRQETTADTPGKIIEAVRKVVDALDTLTPNDTRACEEYRNMVQSRTSHGLGHLKRLGILHHLELMLQND